MLIKQSQYIQKLLTTALMRRCAPIGIAFTRHTCLVCSCLYCSEHSSCKEFQPPGSLGHCAVDIASLVLNASPSKSFKKQWVYSRKQTLCSQTLSPVATHTKPADSKLECNAISTASLGEATPDSAKARSSKESRETFSAAMTIFYLLAWHYAKTWIQRCKQSNCLDPKTGDSANYDVIKHAAHVF